MDITLPQIKDYRKAKHTKPELLFYLLFTALPDNELLKEILTPVLQQHKLQTVTKSSNCQGLGKLQTLLHFILTITV